MSFSRSSYLEERRQPQAESWGHWLYLVARGRNSQDACCSWDPIQPHPPNRKCTEYLAKGRSLPLLHFFLPSLSFLSVRLKGSESPKGITQSMALNHSQVSGSITSLHPQVTKERSHVHTLFLGVVDCSRDMHLTEAGPIIPRNWEERLRGFSSGKEDFLMRWRGQGAETGLFCSRI